MELGKKQSHDSSIADSAIVTDLYQRLKTEMNKNKETTAASTATCLSTTIQAPEVGANEILVSEEVTVDDEEHGSVDSVVEEENCSSEPCSKRIKLSGGDDFLTDADLGIHHDASQVNNSLTGNLVEEMAASRVLLSLNGDPS